jgi:uncharacterized protein
MMERMNNNISIGKAGTHNVQVDLDVLLRSRLLVTADSGGGKTVLLKLLCERIFGKIPILIIDPEGEFAPLRKKFGFVLVGPGGETSADPRSAGLVAQTLLKLKASAVCDIYEMKPSQRHEFVKNFCEALIDAPKNLWHPTIVIVDEAHMFCPEGKAGESVATDAVKSLSTRGRKRGLCAVYATQRLAEFNKGASSMCLNRLVGGTFEDVNQERAVNVLSVTREEKHDFLKQLKLLEPGYFFALGRAICIERTLVKVDPIQTPHGDEALKYATEPPPPPEAIAKYLPQLSDLPKQAEEKARTEEQLRGEVRELKRQLAVAGKLELSAKDLQKMDELQKAVQALNKYAGKCEDFIIAQGTTMARVIKELQSMCDMNPPDPEFKITKNIQKFVPAGSSFVNPKLFVPANRPVPKPPVDSDGLTGPELRILKGLAQLDAIGMSVAPKAMVAGWARYSVDGGGFNNSLGALRTKMLIEYPSAGYVKLTPEGAEKIGFQQPPSLDQVHLGVLDICTGPEKKILAALIQHGSQPISKEELAALSGYSVDGGGYNNSVGALRTKGFLDYPRAGVVKAEDWLFQS